MFKLSVITDEISSDFVKAVKVALSYKLDGVEIRSVWKKPAHLLTDSEVTHIQRILENNELEVSAVASSFFKCSIASKQEYQAHLEILRRSIALAKRLGTYIVRGFTFWKLKIPPSGTNQVESRFAEEKLVETYREAARIAEGEGIIIAVENEESTMVATGEKLAQFIDAVNSPAVKALWDMTNGLYYNEEIPFPDGYRFVKGKIAHVHVKDIVYNPEKKAGEPVPVGKGVVDIKGQLHALKKDGYTGFVSLETHTPPSADAVRKFPQDTEPGEVATRECLDALQEILRGL